MIGEVWGGWMGMKGQWIDGEEVMRSRRLERGSGRVGGGGSKSETGSARAVSGREKAKEKSSKEKSERPRPFCSVVSQHHSFGRKENREV